VKLHARSGKVIIPASSLVDGVKNHDSNITITTDYSTFELPLHLLNLEELAKRLGVEIADLSINISQTVLRDDLQARLVKAVSEAGGSIASVAVDFSIVVEASNGKSIALDHFGRTFVKRSISLAKPTQNSATVSRFDPNTNQLSFVPSIIGANEAEFMRNGNSIYTVIVLSKTFEDIANHWAKADIELLASKLIVSGISAHQFEANRSITRAEFAALAVRALGLTINGEARFSDVKANSWYSSAVATAAEAGIIKGYEDGTFRPNQFITRQELAVMVMRAMDYAGAASNSSDTVKAGVLDKFSDAGQLSWAREEVAEAIHAGIINGVTATTIKPTAEATRAEAVVMLKRFLLASSLISK